MNFLHDQAMNQDLDQDMDQNIDLQPTEIYTNQKTITPKNWFWLKNVPVNPITKIVFEKFVGDIIKSSKFVSWH